MIIPMKISEYNKLIQLLKNCRMVGSSAILYNDVMICYNIMYTLIGNYHYCNNTILPIPKGYVYNISNVDTVISQMEVKGRKDKITATLTTESISVDISFKDKDDIIHVEIAQQFSDSHVLSCKEKYIRDTKTYEHQSSPMTISFDPRLSFNDIPAAYNCNIIAPLSTHDIDQILSGGLVVVSVSTHNHLNTIVRINRNLVTHVTAATKLQNTQITTQVSPIVDDIATIVLSSTINEFNFIDVYKFVPYTI